MTRLDVDKLRCILESAELNKLDLIAKIVAYEQTKRVNQYAVKRFSGYIDKAYCELKNVVRDRGDGTSGAPYAPDAGSSPAPARGGTPGAEGMPSDPDQRACSGSESPHQAHCCSACILHFILKKGTKVEGLKNGDPLFQDDDGNLITKDGILVRRKGEW